MIPATRQEFKDYVLRGLGKGAIEINVTAEQLDDRLDQAIKYYGDYHYDGVEKRYFQHVITDTDVTNRYIDLPDNVIGVVGLWSLSTAISTGNMFDVRYQIALNDLYTFTNVSMIPYYMAFQQIQLIEQLLVGAQPIRFNRHTNRVYLDMDWKRIPVGEQLVLTVYWALDPTTNTDMWGDRFLYLYTKALVKEQWGQNLGKFDMVLPGGIKWNGAAIKAEGREEIKDLEDNMTRRYGEPIEMFMG